MIINLKQPLRKGPSEGPVSAGGLVRVTC
jgi:hypothetical protein